MMGVHVMDVNNPSRNYPKAIIIGSLATVCIFVLGTFALGLIIPAKDINLTQSLLIGFDNYFRHFHISWAGPVIAIALMFGVLASVLMWIMGGVGFAGSLLAFVLSFIPPGQIETGSNAVWYTVLIAGCVIMVIVPFIIYAMRKPSWRDPASDFAPFNWEKQQ